jgi:hypothetical protein
VSHIQLLESLAFAPERSTERHLAFQFADELGFKHEFDKESGLAGYDWPL